LFIHSEIDLFIEIYFLSTIRLNYLLGFPKGLDT